MAVDTVEVWLILTRVPEPALAGLAALLDAGERARAEAMPVADRRHRFVVAHAAARLIIGHRLETSPHRLRWEHGPHGKPELAGGSSLRVNLSHSGELAALALAAGRPVGVDLQELRPVDACGLARRFFPATEARFVAAATEPGIQVARFTRLWARKEAYVKAVGARLMDGMAVPVRPPGVVSDPAGALPGPYRIQDLAVPDGYRAAVAVGGPAPFRQVRHWWAPPP